MMTARHASRDCRGSSCTGIAAPSISIRCCDAHPRFAFMFFLCQRLAALASPDVFLAGIGEKHLRDSPSAAMRLHESVLDSVGEAVFKRDRCGAVDAVISPS